MTFMSQHEHKNKELRCFSAPWKFLLAVNCFTVFTAKVVNPHRKSYNCRFLLLRFQEYTRH